MKKNLSTQIKSTFYALSARSTRQNHPPLCSIILSCALCLSTGLRAQSTIAPDVDLMLRQAQEQPLAFPPLSYRILRHLPPFVLEKNEIPTGSLVIPQDVPGVPRFPMEKGMVYRVASSTGKLWEFIHPGGYLGAESMRTGHAPYWYLRYGQRNKKWDKAVLTALYVLSYNPTKSLQQWELAERAGYQIDILHHWSKACAYASLGDRENFNRCVEAIGPFSAALSERDFPHEEKDWFQLAQMMGHMKLLAKVSDSFSNQNLPISEQSIEKLIELEEKNPYPAKAPVRAAMEMKRIPFLKNADRQRVTNQGLVRQAQAVEGSAVSRFAPIHFEAKANQFASIRLMAPGNAKQMDVQLEFQFTNQAQRERTPAKFARLVELSIMNSSKHPAKQGEAPSIDRFRELATVSVNAKHLEYGQVSYARSFAHRGSVLYLTRRRIMPDFGPYQFHPFSYLRCQPDHYYQLRIVKVGHWVECLVDNKRIAIFPTSDEEMSLGFYMRVIGSQIRVRSMQGHVLE